MARSTPTPPAGDELRLLGLRDRKRAAAVRHIQRVALDLFERDGYDAVTVAQIAAAADVGERSVYRYFGTKPMLVFMDEIDHLAVDTFARHLGERDVVGAVRAMLDDIEPMLAAVALDESVRRLRLIHATPQLVSELSGYTIQLGDAFGTAIAGSRGQPADDLTCRIHGRTIAVAFGTAIDHWFLHQDDGPLIERLREALEALTNLGASPDR